MDGKWVASKFFSFSKRSHQTVMKVLLTKIMVNSFVSKSRFFKQYFVNLEQIKLDKLIIFLCT